MIYSKEIKEKAKALYESGMTYKEVSAILGVKYKTLAYWGEKEGYGRGTAKYSTDLINMIVDEYENGLNSTELAEKHNISVGTIKYWIKKYSIPRHKGPQSMIKCEEYFDVIDTEEKAYYLGYIMADGNVSVYNNQHSLKIHISIKDREVIDNFLKAIESGNKTAIRPDNKYYVSLTSKHMITSLMALGVVPNKTGKEIIPDIPQELIRHFIRGFFDGDGITDIVQKRAGFVSAGPIIYSLHKLLNATGKIQKYQRNEDGMEYYSFLGFKNFNANLYEYMYKDATVWLSRKRERMDIICGNTEVTTEDNNQ